MLPSLGCFSSLECPFYNGGAGQCSRPYCHYRHVKRDPNAPPEPAEDILGPVPIIEPRQAEDVLKAESNSEIAHKSRAPMYKAIVEAAPAYNPTPIAQLKSSHIPIPYTPTIPTRSSAVKKSKPSSEYVPHHVGTSRPSYPTYSPSSIGSLNSHVPSTSIDPLKNPLYEIYGPEGAQYSPNDVEPVATGYSYAPESASYAPYSPEYVPSKVKYNPRFNPPDSQLSDDDDNVDLAAETAAQTNGDPGGGDSLIDLDLSELDNLEFEFEDDAGDNENETAHIEHEENEISNSGNETVVVKSSNDDPNYSHGSSSHKAEKRRSSSTSSATESKKHKISHESSDKHKLSHKSSDKNGVKEKKQSSSSSSSVKKSSSSSSSHSKKSSDHSSSKSKSSSSSSSKPSKTSSSAEEKKSHSSDLKLKTGSSSSSSSSSKHRDKHRDKEKSTDKEKSKAKEKDKHHGKDTNKDHSKSKHSKKSSHCTSDGKAEKNDVQREKIDEEIKMIELELDASLEDEDMIEQQCYEMFSEYSETLQNQPDISKTEDQRVTINEEPAPSAPSKKRIAHQSSYSSVQPDPKPVPTLAKKCSPYQVMKDRWEMLKKEKLESASLAVAPAHIPKAPAPAPYSSTNAPQASLSNSGLGGKKKIAGVANVAMLLKPPSTTKTSTSASSKSATSPSRFYNKGSQRIDEYGRLVKVRVAHAPNMDTPVMRKPVVTPSDCRKFKVATRQANVNKLYQAYLDAGFGDASHDMALDSERTSTQGTESLGVYSHRIIQILKDLRACAETSQNGPKMDGMSGVPNRVVSHNAMLAGKLGTKVSWSIQSSKKEAESKSRLSLYEQLQSYVLTKEQLEENGFPMPSSEKGCASIKPSSYRVINQPADPRERICVRCLKPYSVNKRGDQVKAEECFYHWGRKLTTRQYRQAESKYTCCDGTETGCSVSPYHVFEQNWEKTSGFMSTLSKPRMESNPGVYALDCEMCYTTAGLELTRVTVIKEDLSVAYEALVKPAHKILDYNTRYSGITEEDLKNVNTSILQVQATLLGMFCDKTILVGHSLESDMKALKLIHPTVVDTSVVFPHKMGPPQKRALRNLAADYLKKIIQNDVGGHDSKEDAVAALELMLWKLKEDEKTR